jgi:hypothetical protein
MTTPDRIAIQETDGRGVDMPLDNGVKLGIIQTEKLASGTKSSPDESNLHAQEAVELAPIENLDAAFLVQKMWAKACTELILKSLNKYKADKDKQQHVDNNTAKPVLISNARLKYTEALSKYTLDRLERDQMDVRTKLANHPDELSKYLKKKTDDRNTAIIMAIGALATAKEKTTVSKITTKKAMELFFNYAFSCSQEVWDDGRHKDTKEAKRFESFKSMYDVFVVNEPTPESLQTYFTRSGNTLKDLDEASKDQPATIPSMDVASENDGAAKSGVPPPPEASVDTGVSIEAHDGVSGQ